MITESLSGIRPAGLSSFSQIRQRDGMALRIVRMFDKSFDTEVRRANGKFCIEAISSGMEAGPPVLGEGVADELKYGVRKFLKMAVPGRMLFNYRGLYNKSCYNPLK